MLTRTKTLAFLLTLAVANPAALLNAAPAPESTNSTTMVFDTNAVTQADWKGKTYDIYAATTNIGGDRRDQPAQWRFAIVPTLISDFDADNLPHLDVIEWARAKHAVPGGFEYSVTSRVGLKFHLRNPEVMSVAIARLDEHFKLMNHRFTAAQVMTMPIAGLSVNFTDLIPAAACKVVNPRVPASTTEGNITIWFECTDKSMKGYSTEGQSVRELRTKLPFTNIEFTVQYNARQARVHVASVTRKSIRGTDFYAKLAGKGTTDVLISRDELQKLARANANSIIAEVYDGNQTIDKFVSDALAAASEETITANDGQLKQMFNPHDISPDEINKQLEDNLDKTSTEENVTFNTGGGGSFFDVLKADGHMNGSNFKKWMAEKHIRVEFEGKKWVAKSVDVLRVNLSKLEEAFSRSYTNYEINEAAGMPSESRQIRLEAASKSGE
jgi:hypothetical protein